MTLDELAALERDILEAAAAGRPVVMSVADAAALVIAARGGALPEKTPGKPHAAPREQRAAQPVGLSLSDQPRPPRHTATKASARREGLLRLLSDGLPRRSGELLAALEAADPNDPTVQLMPLLDCPWFEKTDPANRLSPWRLTGAGRAALADLPPGSSTA